MRTCIYCGCVAHLGICAPCAGKHPGVHQDFVERVELELAETKARNERRKLSEAQTLPAFEPLSLVDLAK